MVQENERLAALARYAILDTTAEEAFDELVRLASAICRTPIALISLVDATRQWFKARVGLDASETPRSGSFCTHAIGAERLFVIPDARSDARFAQNPLVTGDPFIRFYAGAPLTTPDGFRLGTLCVIDRQPRALDATQEQALVALARQVVVQLELRRQLAQKAIAEQELRRSEARTRSIIDNAPGGLITIDEDGIIESVNPAAERMLGFEAGQMIGEPLGPLIDAAFDLHAARNRVIELQARRRSGDRFTCEVSVFEFYADDQRHFAANLLDVSERHVVERMKRDFISTVSHELRTPLTSIRGSLGLLASGVMGELPAEAEPVISVAERNSVRLISLINDILDFDRLESGRMTMNLRPTPLLRVLERSIESISAVAMQDGVRIELQGNGVEVIGDEERLMQVTVNLLSNAVKYSHRGATVVVSASVHGASAEVRVADRGRGIPAELQQKLFRRFERADSSDARTKPGSGLGLAICKAIVEQHGGAIGMASREGVGSTFWFRVPAVAAAVPA
jgi:PAS domain S-box-containing protein